MIVAGAGGHMCLSSASKNPNPGNKPGVQAALPSLDAITSLAKAQGPAGPVYHSPAFQRWES